MFVGSMIPNSDFSQLTRIPDMLEHYELHLEEIGDLDIEFTFWEFVKIHFITPDDHEHDDNDEHQNCPFQSFCSPLNFVLSVSDLCFFGNLFTCKYR